MLKQRLDPPQKAAIAVSAGTPVVVGAVYVALRTDWLRQVGGDGLHGRAARSRPGFTPWPPKSPPGRGWALDMPSWS